MLSALVLLAQSTGPLDVAGTWRIPPEEEGGPDRGVVEIVMEDGAPVGRVVRIGEAIEDTEAARGVLGTKIVWGFERDEDDGEWDDGKIRDPEADRTYDAKMRRQGEALSVEGCVLFICREQVWLPAPQPDVAPAP